jgi:hypothetical protein
VGDSRIERGDGCDVDLGRKLAFSDGALQPCLDDARGALPQLAEILPGPLFAGELLMAPLTSRHPCGLPGVEKDSTFSLSISSMLSRAVLRPAARRPADWR